MIIKTPSGNLPHKLFTFPDGQRHFILQGDLPEWREATIETRITNAEDLFDVLIAKDALTAAGYVVSLDIRYLLAARMDRRISKYEPATLDIVARVLNSAGFQKIRILDPHSVTSLALLKAEAVMPVHAVELVLASYEARDTVVVAPDAGATARVRKLLYQTANDHFIVVQGLKHRDPSTGNLSGFSVTEPSLIKDKRCLILDDICDGGGTFVGLAEVLKGHGATSVDLFVTHGIFSKGAFLKGISNIYTTDSYRPAPAGLYGATIIEVTM